MIFFTSDLHFHHNKIMQYSPIFRKYADLDEMREALISIWNDTVKKDDLVYNLGDFSMTSNLDKIIDTARRLNGRHILILGNHDYTTRKNRNQLLEEMKDDGNRLFENIEDYVYLRLKEKGRELALSHYPMGGWEGQQHGSIMLHGHLHDYITYIRGKILNVGFDLHGKILSLDEILRFTDNLPVLPYRNENDEIAQSIKATNTIEARRKMIMRELERINKGNRV